MLCQEKRRRIGNNRKMSKDPMSFKASELKNKLLALELQTSGTKAELVSRLNAADSTEGWILRLGKSKKERRERQILLSWKRCHVNSSL